MLLALDVAILLPSRYQQRLLDLNTALLPPPEGFRFNPTHLPHISLIQQFTPESCLDDFIRETTTQLSDVPPLDIRTTGLTHGRTTSALGVSLTGALMETHTRLMDRLQHLDAGTGNKSAFFIDQEPPRQDDVTWVTHFRTRAAYEQFDPHITLGVGKMQGVIPPIHTIATHLAICHLGRFCTCRHILTDLTLTPNDA
mgnify:CR=1 FL=1